MGFPPESLLNRPVLGSARLSSLNADLAKEAVRDRAAAEINEGRLEMLKTEGWRPAVGHGACESRRGWCGWRRIPSSSASPCWPLGRKWGHDLGGPIGDHSERGLDRHRHRAEPCSALPERGGGLLKLRTCCLMRTPSLSSWRTSFASSSWLS